MFIIQKTFKNLSVQDSLLAMGPKHFAQRVVTTSLSPMLLPPTPPVEYEAREEGVPGAQLLSSHVAETTAETLKKMRVNLTVQKLFPPLHYQKREVDKGD